MTYTLTLYIWFKPFTLEFHLYCSSSLCVSQKVPITVRLPASSTTKDRYILTPTSQLLLLTACMWPVCIHVYIPSLCSSYTHSL